MLRFGIATIFALVFRRSDLAPVRPGVLAAICVAMIAIFGSWHASSTLQKGLDMYAVRSAPVQVLSEADWRGSRWHDLPQTRLDLAGESEEPFAVQWAGEPAELASSLQRAGWMTAEVASLANVRTFFGLAANASTAIPVLPTMHDGALPLVVLTRQSGDARNRQVLRAWSSGTAISRNGRQMPLMLVSAVTEQIERPLGISSIPETIDDLLRPSALAPIQGTEVHWPDGQLLLLATGAPGAEGVFELTRPLVTGRVRAGLTRTAAMATRRGLPRKVRRRPGTFAGLSQSSAPATRRWRIRRSVAATYVLLVGG